MVVTMESAAKYKNSTMVGVFPDAVTAIQLLQSHGGTVNPLATSQESSASNLHHLHLASPFHDFRREIGPLLAAQSPTEVGLTSRHGEIHVGGGVVPISENLNKSTLAWSHVQTEPPLRMRTQNVWVGRS